LGVSVTDKIFDNMSTIQLLWYSNNISKDEIEMFEMVRDMAEYMMAFVNPEVVNKVKESRNGENVKESTLDAEQTLKDIMSDNKDIFGDLGISNKSKQTNNNKELRRDVDFESKLFDLTKEY
jgi:hypothetical protein